MSKAQAAGISKWIVACAGGLGLAAYVFVYAMGRAGPPIPSDGFSYYVYLPSWFIFHDPTLAATARDCCGGEFPACTTIALSMFQMLQYWNGVIPFSDMTWEQYRAVFLTWR